VRLPWGQQADVSVHGPRQAWARSPRLGGLLAAGNKGLHLAADLRAKAMRLFGNN
jgi:hypothetical protein